MGTRGLEIVRFRGRCYIRYHQFDTYFEGLGAKIVASIPADPEEYHSTVVKIFALHYANACRMARIHANGVCG
jgi:hypothetical protein